MHYCYKYIYVYIYKTYKYISDLGKQQTNREPALAGRWTR